MYKKQYLQNLDSDHLLTNHLYLYLSIGYDAGGLTREWISLVSTSLFDPTNQMFTQFNKDDKQSLVRTLFSCLAHMYVTNQGKMQMFRTAT